MAQMRGDHAKATLKTLFENLDNADHYWADVSADAKILHFRIRKGERVTFIDIVTKTEGETR
jgi:hypothetical protein